MKYVVLSIAAFIFIGCSEPNGVVQQDATVIDTRWYSASQVTNGQKLFETNCAACHGREAQGTILPWNKTLESGKYPPPPLNGTAHGWHHPLDILRYTINEGGKPMGGDMPSFKEALNDEEVDSIIAYFQNYWSKEIYDQWKKISGLKDK